MTAHPSMPVRPITAGAHRPESVGRPAPLPWWGWIEWTIFLQTLMPALLFIPAVAYSKARVILRVSAFGVSLMAWIAIALWGRPAVGRRFPAQPWLAAAGAWLVLEIFHPTTNSLTSGLAACVFNLSIMLPAFWATSGQLTARRVNRIMVLLFLTNGAGALMGIAQFYQPERFNPPVIPLLEMNEQNKHDLMFTAADGRRVLRPCGLTDTPGGAGLAGSVASLIGLAWAMGRVSRWKRLLGFSISAVGLAAIMLSLARVTLVGQFISFAVLFALLMLQKDYRRVKLMSVASCVILVAAVGWSVREGGEGVTKRYASLIDTKPTEVYGASRGGYLRQAFEELIWKWPLGGGLGRWGMVNFYFGNRTLPEDHGGQFWIEIQWSGWIIDGGIPYLLLYVIAIGAALASILRIALRCRDPDIAFWAAVLFALGLNTVAVCFVGCAFNAPMGIQFWVLAAMIHAAGERAGYGPRSAASLASASARKAT